jgi:deoxycytidine triphosphate deaminase
MILGTDKLLELIKKKNLIEGLDEEDINIEGCGIDLRIGEIFEMEGGEGFIYKDTRKTPFYKSIAEFKKGESRRVKLEPGKFYVAKTVEVINTPKDLFGIFIPRGTFFANGVLALGFRVDPGYKGNFRFHLVNIGGSKFEIEMGSRIANMIFLEVKGKTNQYIGQWQGGRAFIRKEEKQTRQK